MVEESVLDILCGADEDDSGEEASTFDLFIGSLRIAEQTAAAEGAFV